MSLKRRLWEDEEVRGSLSQETCLELVQSDHEELVEYDMQGDAFAVLFMRDIFVCSGSRGISHVAYSPCPSVPTSQKAFFMAMRQAPSYLHEMAFADRWCYTIRINARNKENI